MWPCVISKKCSDIKVIAFGNALVSYTAYLEDTKLLDRFKLCMNTRSEIDIPTMSQITAEINANKKQYEPKLGGSAINSICILKSLGTNALFFGACGKDELAEVIYDLLRSINMDRYHFKLQTVPNAATGQCLSLLYKDSKSLYTSSGASSEFTGSYLQQIEKEENGTFLRPPNRKQIFYIEGFFVPKCEVVTTFIVRHYIGGRRYVALNLSAEYIVRINFPHMLFLANNALFIFGKRCEFEAFSECWGVSGIKELAVALTKESKIPKILVITNGPDSVEMITNFVWGQSSAGNLRFYTFHVTPNDNVTDTTGCGDVLVAVFLHEWLKKRSLSQCLRKATFLATKSIQQNGRCSFHESLLQA